MSAVVLRLDPDTRRARRASGPERLVAWREGADEDTLEPEALDPLIAEIAKMLAEEEATT